MGPADMRANRGKAGEKHGCNAIRSLRMRSGRAIPYPNHSSRDAADADCTMGSNKERVLGMRGQFVGDVLLQQVAGTTD